jgi:hypothetical protein
MRPIKSFSLFLFSSAVLAFLLPAPGAQAEVVSWGNLLEQSAGSSEMAPHRTALLKEAEDVLAEPIIRRVYRFEDIGKHRTQLDARALPLEEEIQATFALAMSDYTSVSALSKELPLVAAAYRLTNEARFLDRIVTQLEEMASWSPIQRPGWSCYKPGNRLPEGGIDGNWLATGRGIRAIGDTLDLLPKDAAPKELVAKMHILLEAEIASIDDDWRLRRPWFVKKENPITNQWVLPTEGLVRACLMVDKERHAEAYELGVRNLLAALNVHGDKGEYEEGFIYSTMTVTSMVHAAHAMALAGDLRAVDHPFLKNFGMWFVQHFQPGNMVINCFDANRCYGAAEDSREFLSLLAVTTGDPAVRWALAHQVSGPSNDIAGLAARMLPPVPVDYEPPLFARYERAARVNWRSSWQSDANGVWVRGGHALDQHDHQDRGHVNFIAKGKPILIEAGTPAYHHPRMMAWYSSGVGHNVLQIGVTPPPESSDTGQRVWFPGWQKPSTVAPISVFTLDEGGGHVIVESSRGYDEVTLWRRTVKWDATTLTVRDKVDVREEIQEPLLLRWHLGTEEPVTITGKGERFAVEWNAARIEFESNEAIEVTQTTLFDHTLEGHSPEDEPGNTHTTVIVQTVRPVVTLVLDTRVSVK